MGRHGRERKDRQWNTGKEKRKRKSGRTRCGSEDLSHKAREVERRLAEAIPQTRVELDHGNVLELLVATILSAQCTDKRVNEVTARLFQKHTRPEDYLAVREEVLEKDMNPFNSSTHIGFGNPQVGKVEIAATICLGRRFACWSQEFSRAVEVGMADTTASAPFPRGCISTA